MQMAKRRKLEAPSVADLDKLEEEFRRETTPRGPLGGAVPPIAQVAAETASQTHAEGTEARAERARLHAELEQYQSAEAEGRMLIDLPLGQINADAMIRDRTVLDETEMMELRQSIAANGLRLPIEVYEMKAPGDDGMRYALLSGYRRYIAVQGLFDLTKQIKYQTIRAIVRPAPESDDAFVAMVEENEVRSELSHFERGRIAVISSQQGVFTNTEEAVNRLFSTGSKSKRSKVRSFAMIFEELGDMLLHPEQLTEKRGLRIAQALRHGAEPRLREALSDRSPETADEEWVLMEPVILDVESGPRKPSLGGRPRTKASPSDWDNADTRVTSSGITIRKKRDSAGFVIRFEGQAMDAERMDNLMEEIRALLEKH
jgi:ParB family chromosome partitioning protein